MKNYTTSIACEKSLAAIQQLLANQGASRVMTEYKETIPIGIAFTLETRHGPMPFLLSANAEGVLSALNNDSRVPARLKCSEQAHRVSWRIILHWLENQLSMVEAEMAEFYQVMIPYLQIEGGQTVIESFEDRGQLLLEQK